MTAGNAWPNDFIDADNVNKFKKLLYKCLIDVRVILSNVKLSILFDYDVWLVVKYATQCTAMSICKQYVHNGLFYQRLTCKMSKSACSPFPRGFSLSFLSFAFAFLMFTLCEIVGSFIYKFVLHLEGVCIFNYNLSLGEPF